MPAILGKNYVDILRVTMIICTPKKQNFLTGVSAGSWDIKLIFCDAGTCEHSRHDTENRRLMG
jgi:hypothetical protein